jgi:hypothetical protein
VLVRVRWRSVWWFHPLGSSVSDYLRAVLPACSASWWILDELHNNAGLLRRESEGLDSALAPAGALLHMTPGISYGWCPFCTLALQGGLPLPLSNTVPGGACRAPKLHPLGSRIPDYLRLVLTDCTWWFRKDLHNNPGGALYLRLL